MAESGFDIDEVAELIRLVESRQLDELVVEDGEHKVVVRGRGFAARRKVAPNYSSAPLEPEAELEDAPQAKPILAPAQETGVPIVAPTVGVYYSSPNPDEPAFVSVGEHVEAGQTIGLLEAMKVFSEIPSDKAGTILKIVAKSGQLMRSGEPIMFVKEEG